MRLDEVTLLIISIKNAILLFAQYYTHWPCIQQVNDLFTGHYPKLHYPKLHYPSAYSTFYIVGLICSMQVPFVGFQPLRTSEHMAALGVFGLLQIVAFLHYVKAATTKKQFEVCLAETTRVRVRYCSVVQFVRYFDGFALELRNEKLPKCQYSMGIVLYVMFVIGMSNFSSSAVTQRNSYKNKADLIRTLH